MDFPFTELLKIGQLSNTFSKIFGIFSHGKGTVLVNSVLGSISVKMRCTRKAVGKFVG